MVKSEVIYTCQSCGQTFPRWAGQCPACGEWNTLLEEEIQNPKSKFQTIQTFQTQYSKPEKPVPITEIDFKMEERELIGMEELDNILGGGIVPGVVILIAGEPGIGKSTLMLQVAASLSRQKKVLYVSGEESAKQIRLRGERLGTLSHNLILLPETNLFMVEKAMGEIKPDVLVVDSVQTLFREDIPSAPGSVVQVKESANYLVRMAKTLGIPIFLIGHVTKEGNIAGPKVLEHVVDTVLYFEGERHKQYRILRVTKNRFGGVNDVAIFEMRENGLAPVLNPSQLFLLERPKDAPGSVITAAIEGSRPLLLEIQALVSFTKMAYPLRKVTGVDYNRASMIIAVIEKRLGYKLSSQDIYINAVGGANVYEPAIDLAIALAIASSYKNKPIDAEAVIFGEVGLTGEVRSVSHLNQRVREAEKLGFKKTIMPLAEKKELGVKNIQLKMIGSLGEAVNAVLQ